MKAHQALKLLRVTRRIILIRHGKPYVPDHGKLRAKEINQWIKSYDSDGLIANHVPTREAIEIANSCSTVVCSDLHRSIESAHALGMKSINIMEPIFREMGLPYSTLPSPKLSPNTWAAIFWLFWVLIKWGVFQPSQAEGCGGCKFACKYSK